MYSINNILKQARIGDDFSFRLHLDSVCLQYNFFRVGFICSLMFNLRWNYVIKFVYNYTIASIAYKNVSEYYCSRFEKFPLSFLSYFADKLPLTHSAVPGWSVYMTCVLIVCVDAGCCVSKDSVRQHHHFHEV